LLLVLVLSLALPVGVFAQDGEKDIVDIAVEDGRFTTLVAALQAAELVDALKGDGPFTVFAPTDDAFAALPEGTVDALLNDIPALTDILLYHVVEGKAMAADVVGLDAVTTLQGSDISITVEDGNVYLDGTVQVIITDIEAANGVIHVIDTVLLPPADMPEDMTEVHGPDAARVRLAHFSPDTPAVELYVAGELSDVQGLEFGQVTDWIALPAATYNMAVAPAGTSFGDAAIGPINYELQAGSYTTIAAIGSLANGTLTAQVLREDFGEYEEGNARVAVFHAIEDAPAVDLILADGTVLASGLEYASGLAFNSGLVTLDVPAGTYDIQVVPSGATEPVVLDLAGTTFDAGTNYFVAAIGTLDNPGVALAATPEMMPMAMAADEPMGTIVDIAVADGRFTTLVAAVEAAGLVDALSGEGPLTVFAPTDDAFAAAFEALGIEAADLLADTDTLTSILLYHVVEGQVMAEDVVGLDAAPTLNGAEISISVTDDGVFLNDDIQVIITDIVASNGVIHVIDGVLLPPQ